MHCCMRSEFGVILAEMLLQNRRNQDAQTSAYFSATGYGQEKPSPVGGFMSHARHPSPTQTIAAVLVQKIAHSCEPWWLQTVASVPIRLRGKFSDWCIRRGKLNVPDEFWGSDSPKVNELTCSKAKEKKCVKTVIKSEAWKRACLTDTCQR